MDLHKGYAESAICMDVYKINTLICGCIARFVAREVLMALSILSDFGQITVYSNHKYATSYSLARIYSYCCF